MTLEGARILISGVVLGQPMGGVRRHNAELVPRLAARLESEGASLTILEGHEPIAFELPGSVQRIACDVPAGPPLQRALAERRAVRSVMARAHSESRPFSLFHTAHLPVPRGLTLPVTLTLHDLRRLDSTHSTTLRRATARFTLRRAVRTASRVFCVSKAVRNELADKLRLASDRITLLGNAADHFVPEERSPTPASPILCIGHLEPRKNLELLLRALALDSNLPGLVLAGASKGQEAERLQQLARDLQVEGRVQFAGPFEEDRLPALLAGAACCVQPSRIEGFGIGVLEAQRARVPLALSDIPALREVSGGHAHFFDPEDAAACAAALRLALSTAEVSLAEAEQNARRYSWDRVAEDWLAGWSELIRS